MVCAVLHSLRVRETTTRKDQAVTYRPRPRHEHPSGPAASGYHDPVALARGILAVAHLSAGARAAGGALS